MSNLIKPFNSARFGLLAALLWLAMTILAACADEPTKPPPTATGPTPGPTSQSTGSGIVGQAASNGQPLPTPIPPGPDTRKVLTVWTSGWKGNVNYEKFINDQIDAYRVRNRNTTIDWLDFGADLPRKFEESLAQPGKLTPPDLVLFEEGDLYQFGANGNLTDLTVLGGSSLKDDFVPATWEALRIGSVSYGMPWLASTRVTIINKRLWQGAGLDPAKTPATLTDLDPLLPTLAKKTGDNVLPVWVKPDPLVDFMMEDAPLYNISGDGKARQTAFPSSGTLARWQYYKDKRMQGVFDPDGLSKDYADALKKYSAGGLVMVLDGTPLLPGLKNANADLYNNTLVVPYLTSKANILPLDISGWAIPKASGKATEALAFLRFLNTAENQLTFARYASLKVPSFKKALSDPYVTSQDEPLAQARSIMAATLDRGRAPESLLPSPLKPGQREKLLNALYDAQKAIWTTDKSPKDALTDAAKVWGEILK